MIVSSRKVPSIGLGLTGADYWRFLCHTYGMGALEAWSYIKRMGNPPSAADVRAAIARVRPC